MIELMEDFIYKNYHKILNSDRIKTLENTAEMNKKYLQKNFSRHQKRLLLRIGDAKDLKAEICSHESFIAGFKMGLKIGYEVNKD